MEQNIKESWASTGSYGDNFPSSGRRFHVPKP